MTPPRSVLVLLGLLLACTASPARACLWDTDTLAAETKGVPDVIDIVLGWYDRNPPLFYAMRLARVTELLQKQPDNLEAYDDAGVACDRLGRGDEAIAWMEKKKARMDAMPADTPGLKDHRYRYLANLGTFWAHRWVHNGADRAKIDQMKKARDYIAAAMKLNPDAHFGRERYQLRAMEWIIDPPPPVEVGAGAETQRRLPDPIGLNQALADDLKKDEEAAVKAHFEGRSLERLGYADAVKGISGLIVLGAAQESVDIHHALAVACTLDRRSSVGFLATLRVGELAMSGRRSMHPDAPQGEALAEALANQIDPQVDETRREELVKYFAKMREAADLRRQHRDAFMMRKLRDGRHPDTDPRFWEGFIDLKKPAYADPLQVKRESEHFPAAR